MPTASQPVAAAAAAKPAAASRGDGRRVRPRR
eukprot:CAMPEP_0119061672 /NCGR_PEP_ID=MMETSP1178-20130426/5443_1 /TAXON_ID=33656 /ORGANISM="unid sp, Strain CCMP2000" /LENGTH=31 /DNA_ID= /DNA_START= /DNA_END= /DNA_ORIENTATION=